MTVGRAADLIVDDNPYLHLEMVRISELFGIWWIDNVGATIPLRLGDLASPSFSIITPGTSVPLGFVNSVLRFEAGPTSYELELEVVAPSRITEFVPRPARQPADILIEIDSFDISPLPLTPEQRLLLVALAEPRLRAGRQEPVFPSNEEVAARLGWTLTKFNRKLDHVCGKLARRGIPGLRGTVGRLAHDRRRRLVDYAVASGLVDTTMLAHLPPLPPRP
jgi:hypothetical protein